MSELETLEDYQKELIADGRISNNEFAAECVRNRIKELKMSEIKIGSQWLHKKKDQIAIVQYISATGGVGYRIRWTRREYYSERKNFLKNYKPYERA